MMGCIVSIVTVNSEGLVWTVLLFNEEKHLITDAFSGRRCLFSIFKSGLQCRRVVPVVVKAVKFNNRRLCGFSVTRCTFYLR